MVEINRFLTKTDTGKEYVIIEDQEYIDTSSHDDANAKTPGLRSLRTVEGLDVNRIDSETFKIVITNEIVRKV